MGSVLFWRGRVRAKAGKWYFWRADGHELERAKVELTRRGGEVRAIQCDLGERSQIQAAMAEVLRCYGRIDVLFNNGGIIQ